MLKIWKLWTFSEQIVPQLLLGSVGERLYNPFFPSTCRIHCKIISRYPTTRLFEVGMGQHLPDLTTAIIYLCKLSGNSKIPPHRSNITFLFVIKLGCQTAGKPHPDWIVIPFQVFARKSQRHSCLVEPYEVYSTINSPGVRRKVLRVDEPSKIRRLMWVQEVTFAHSREADLG